MRSGSEWRGDGEERAKTIHPIFDCQLTSYCFVWLQKKKKNSNELNVLIQFIWLSNFWLSSYVLCENLNVDCQIVHSGRKNLFAYNGLMIVWQFNYTAGEFWRENGVWRQVCLSTLKFIALSSIWSHSILPTEQVSHSTHSKKVLLDGYRKGDSVKILSEAKLIKALLYTWHWTPKIFAPILSVTVSFKS